MQKNLYAYTANSSPYPEYVSLNERDGKVFLTVREAAKPGAYSSKDCGHTIEVELPRREVPSFVKALAEAME